MPSPPLVSILLPNLNKGPFIGQCIESIRSQTYSKWECLIADSGSNDGSAEALENLARQDSRASFRQTPKDGIYPNWNRCRERANGDYIYIATSDDAMLPTCLERSVAALEANPDAGFCSFNLELIDALSRPLPDAWSRSLNVAYYGDWIHRAHRREGRAEGARVFLLGIVHTAMNGLLIRHRIFEQAGPFPCEYGYAGDLAWQLRALRLAPTVHLPDALAQFRRVDSAATFTMPDYHTRVCQVLVDHLNLAPPEYRSAIAKSLATFRLAADLRETSNPLWKKLAQACRAPLALRLLILRSAVYRGILHEQARHAHQRLIPLDGISAI